MNSFTKILVSFKVLYFINRPLQDHRYWMNYYIVFYSTQLCTYPLLNYLFIYFVSFYNFHNYLSSTTHISTNDFYESWNDTETIISTILHLVFTLTYTSNVFLGIRLFYVSLNLFLLYKCTDFYLSKCMFPGVLNKDISDTRPIISSFMLYENESLSICLTRYNWL